MMIGSTPQPDGGERARNSMEGSDSNFVFGLVALAAILLPLTAWIYLSAPDDGRLPAESVVTTTIAR